MDTPIHTYTCTPAQTSEELRGLERQLKVAYMNKERAAQDRERALLRDMDKCVRVQRHACMHAMGRDATMCVDWPDQLTVHVRRALDTVADSQMEQEQARAHQV